MKKLWLAAIPLSFIYLGPAVVSWAQNAGWPPPAGAQAILGVYNTTPATLANTNVGYVQVDNAGNLKVNVAAGGAAGGTSSTFGSPFPGTGTAAGFISGANMNAASLDSSGYLQVNVKAGSGSGCAGTAGTPCVVYNITPANLQVQAYQTTASNLNMTEANSAAILSAVQGAIPSGSNTIGGVTGVLATAGGWTPKLLNSLGVTPTAVKIGAGQLGKIICYNPQAAVSYIQVFNTTPVTVGTTAPLQSYGVPATSSGVFAFGLVGDQYSADIVVASTTTPIGITGALMDCNASYN